MTESSTTKSWTFPRIAGILLMIAAVIMIIAGGVAWGAVSSQLKAQNMTVSADASSNANKPVAGPFTAWSQQETIGKHVDHSTEGRTYAELGQVVDDAKAQYGDDSQEAKDAQALRNTAMNGSLLRSSLFTSILAFGVAFLVIGLGISTGITGVAIYSLGSRPKAA